MKSAIGHNLWSIALCAAGVLYRWVSVTTCRDPTKRLVAKENSGLKTYPILNNPFVPLRAAVQNSGQHSVGLQTPERISGQPFVGLQTFVRNSGRHSVGLQTLARISGRHSVGLQTLAWVFWRPVVHLRAYVLIISSYFEKIYNIYYRQLDFYFYLP